MKSVFRDLRIQNRFAESVLVHVEGLEGGRKGRFVDFGGRGRFLKRVLVFEGELGNDLVGWVAEREEWGGEEGREVVGRDDVIGLERSVGFSGKLLEYLEDRELEGLRRVLGDGRKGVVVPIGDLEGVRATSRVVVAVGEGKSPLEFVRWEEERERGVASGTIRSVLVGQAICAGCCVRASVLGENVWVLVCSMEGDGFGRVVDRTHVACAGERDHLMGEEGGKKMLERKEEGLLFFGEGVLDAVREVRRLFLQGGKVAGGVVTGPRGVGKRTVVERAIAEVVEEGNEVCVVRIGVGSVGEALEHGCLGVRRFAVDGKVPEGGVVRGKGRRVGVLVIEDVDVVMVEERLVWGMENLRVGGGGLLGDLQRGVLGRVERVIEGDGDEVVRGVRGKDGEKREGGEGGDGRVVVIGVTENGADSVALGLRSARGLAREIVVEMPEERTRLEILRRAMAWEGVEEGDVDLEDEVVKLVGYTPSDLLGLVRVSRVVAESMGPRHAPEDAVSALRRVLAESGARREERVVLTSGVWRAARGEVRPSALTGVTRAPPGSGWDAVGGLEKVKEALQEAVEWPLRCGGLLKRMGASPPRGVLLFGPPGCAKTLLARAAASAASAAFFSLSGADLLSKYVGETERLLRQVFSRARAARPSVLFLDEIDSLVTPRANNAQGLGILATLLTEMDGITSSDGVLVLAATNRPERIDAALLRPGRFELRILVPPPDLEARAAILHIHLSKMPIEGDASASSDLERHLAEQTDRFTGAELAGLCRAAALAALRNHQTSITKSNFEQALHEVTTIYGGRGGSLRLQTDLRKYHAFASGTLEAPL